MQFAVNNVFAQAIRNAMRLGGPRTTILINILLDGNSNRNLHQAVEATPKRSPDKLLRITLSHIMRKSS